MSDNRPPEGARWKIPDWKPFPDAEPLAAPLSDASTTPKMGIEVPITPTDFRAHWKELAHYARLNREDVDFLQSAELQELLDTAHHNWLSLTTEQQRELEETGRCTATLRQIEKITALWHKARALAAERGISKAANYAFSVDYTEWEDLHRQGLVSPHNMSREQLEALDGLDVFDDARLAVYSRGLSVTLSSLVEIQVHWNDLRKWFRVTNHTPSEFFDAIEIIDPEKGTRRPLLTATQLSEMKARGFTYLNIAQVERMHTAGFYQAIPVDSWLALREKGIVSEHHLDEFEVRQLLSVPFFRELFDLKFNVQLIEERARQAAERGKRKRTPGLLAVVAVISIAVVVVYAVSHSTREEETTLPNTAVVPAKEESSSPSSIDGKNEKMEQSPKANMPPPPQRLEHADKEEPAPLSTAVVPAQESNPPIDSISRARSDEVRLLEAAERAYKEKMAELSAVISSAQEENSPFEAIVSAEAKRVAKPAVELPAFSTKPDNARAESIGKEATVRHFGQAQFESAAQLWTQVFIYQPSNLAALHNLAYAKGRAGDKGTAFRFAVLALSINKGSQTAEYWKTWRLIGALASNETGEQRKGAENAYLVAFALNRDWDSVCKTLLEDGRSFGDGVKEVVTGVFDRLPAPPAESPAWENCASPPAF